MICQEDQIVILLDLLDDWRVDDLDSWKEIGHILYSISDKYLELWLRFCQRFENYNKDESIDQWEKCKTLSLHECPMITLKYYAVEDEPELYLYYFPAKEMEE